VVTFLEKQSGYICEEAELLHLWRVRLITFVEKQILHLWINRMVTFMLKQSGYISREAEWLHFKRSRVVTFLEKQSGYIRPISLNIIQKIRESVL
jgi:hypothetical protein